ncbi:hypothetical protein J6590_034475 [Homalodisca vitripennis]|nr:hypothetical protein J6590_034475 [Homalodisca vitripennis]
MADDELLHLLELPRSEFGPMNDDLSDDGGWMSDVSIDDRADLETFTELSNVVYSYNDNECRGSDIDDPWVPEVPEVPATGPNRSKRARKTKEPKQKIFKPKKKMKTKTKNKKSKKPIYPHVWNDTNFVPVNHPYNETNSGVVGRDLYPHPYQILNPLTATTEISRAIILFKQSPRPRYLVQYACCEQPPWASYLALT